MTPIPKPRTRVPTPIPKPRTKLPQPPIPKPRTRIPARQPVLQNRFKYVDQLSKLPPEMIYKIMSTFSSKDKKKFLQAYPAYRVFFTDKFENQLDSLSDYRPKFFYEALIAKLHVFEIIKIKMDIVMKNVAKHANDKHVIYLGKISKPKFSQLIDYMQSQNYFFLKNSYGNGLQRKNVINPSIKRAMSRTDGNVYDYMHIGKVTGVNASQGITSGRSIQDFFNRRSGAFDNRKGKHIKILFISEKFKEGIDLLDVPHIHIIPEPISNDEKEQIVGRVVRRCSRAGTPYNNGWTTNVFEYKILMPKYSIENIGQRLDLKPGNQTEDEWWTKDWLKNRSVDQFISKNVHNFKITPNETSLVTDAIIPLERPDINAANYQQQVQRIFKRFIAKISKMENKCIDQGRFEFTPQQNFIRHYFNNDSRVNTLLLWHAAGAGKTATAIATASSSFEQAGRNIIFVTRNSLVKDIEKNIYGERTAHIRFRGPRLSHAAQSRHINRHWVKPMSYSTFINVISNNYRLINDENVLISNQQRRTLEERNVGQHILNNSLIIIDEIHKLNLEQMQIITNSLAENFTIRPKVLLMSATPFASSDHFGFVMDVFSRGVNVSTAKVNVERLVKGKISYFDPKTDLRYFPKAVTKFQTISIKIPDYDALRSSCNSQLTNEFANIQTSNLDRDEKTSAKRRARNRAKGCKNPKTGLEDISNVFYKWSNSNWRGRG